MMTWLGRGPQETYADRKTGALIGLYNATVWEQFHPYVRAQETPIIVTYAGWPCAMLPVKVCW